MGKLVYKPVGLALGAVAGVAAGYVFKRIWGVIGDADDVPLAMDEERGWGEVIAAAALQGLVFAIMRALVDRAGATGVRKLTGRWPG